MKKSILILTLSIILVNCIGTNRKEKILPNYYLIAPDSEEQLFLSYHKEKDGDNFPELIEPTVFEIGYNNKYIVVKQHPWDSKGSPNKDVTNYYIQPRIQNEFNWKNENSQIGPLTFNGYNQRCKELDIHIIFKKL